MFLLQGRCSRSIIGNFLRGRTALFATAPETWPAVSVATSRKERSNKNDDILITVVTDREKAMKVLQILSIYDEKIWACDTEVMDIDLKTQGPVGNGKVTCVSIYGGPDVDFGSGPGSALWIDNLDQSSGILHIFKDWFENSDVKKVWHNYGFDRHVLNNEGINCKGFAGDTMHMARLWDTSRDKISGGDGYSLASLSSELCEDSKFSKTSMIELFGVGRTLKNGLMSKIRDLPPVEELQKNPEHRDKWIKYSAMDAVATWKIREQLETRLKMMPWEVEDSTKLLGNMFEYYLEYLLPFGELLTDIEKVGIKVDTEVHLKEAEIGARKDRALMLETFYQWAEKFVPSARMINTASTNQIQQFFFGQYEKGILINRERTFQSDKTEDEIAEETKLIKEENPYLEVTASDLRNMLKERKLKLSGTRNAQINRLLQDEYLNDKVGNMKDDELNDICLSKGINVQGTREDKIEGLKKDEFFVMETNEIAVSAEAMKKPKKYRHFVIKTLGMQPLPNSFTPAGTPSVGAAVLKRMAGIFLISLIPLYFIFFCLNLHTIFAGTNVFNEDENPLWGTAYDFFGGGKQGAEACRAIGALARMGQIDTTISNFLVPLQTMVDESSRIHCSLNLNTETGRLSARRPNLQNQPALEKDQYKIRDAFIADEGNTLIVADYGQLELRLLAHITNCESMIEAFKSGGCFHSRTAVGMYPYIKDKVETGEVLLEWDYSKGQPSVPLVKDKYGSERRKAKTLNFSIAYGKTVHGLALDWGISIEEAEKTLEAWYKDRPEVKEWQEKTISMARNKGFVRTLMGRYRRLPDAKFSKGPAQRHALRAAINTPIQGSAADIVVVAMIKLWKSKVLAELGWKQVLQVHDEVILEGPKDSVSMALEEVRQCMESPYDDFGLSKLLVSLDVDAKVADSWYKAK